MSSGSAANQASKVSPEKVEPARALTPHGLETNFPCLPGAKGSLLSVHTQDPGRATDTREMPAAGGPEAGAGGSGLVVTGQNSACKDARWSVAEILGLRFPGRADVAGAAGLLKGASRDSQLRSQIEVSPGSIRFRRTVPPDGGDMPGSDSQSGSGRQAITGWTAKSRRQMLRSYAALDYSPMFDNNGISARVTLTYPDDWLTVAPSREAVQRHFRMFERRFVRAWSEPLISLWKLEYQHRGAPHYHLLMRRPNGTAGQARRARYEAGRLAWEAAGRIGSRPRYRRAHADGLTFDRWLALTWADIVAHPDSEQRAAHVRAGTQVSVKDGLRATDPKRASIYFSKHGVAKGDKEYQNKPPAAWVEAGTGPGRYWGYTGLTLLIVPAQIDGGKDYYVAKRTMRRWSARSRIWDKQARCYRYVKATRTRARGTRKVKRHGVTVEIPRVVRRPVSRLGGRSGAICVNDGPSMADYIARVIALTVDQDQAAQRPRVRPASSTLADALFLCENCGRRHLLREHRGCADRARTVWRVK